MSWKASGYVKELRDGLSVTDKFVLLILAEYHSTEEKASWPSVTTLAADCLMTVRGVQQILGRLEVGGFIVRTKGCGRGNVSGYEIVGVDVKGEPDSPNGRAGFSAQTVNRRVQKDERKTVKGAPPCAAIRKEPLEPQEPIKQKHNLILPEWVPMEAWNGFIEMRRKMRNAPITDRAIKMLFAELCRLREAGEDPERVLNVATMKGWRGLFPVSENKNVKGNGLTRHEQQLNSLRATRAAAYQILERREAADQQSAMDYGQTADDIRGDE